TCPGCCCDSARALAVAGRSGAPRSENPPARRAVPDARLRRDGSRPSPLRVRRLPWCASSPRGWYHRRTVTSGGSLMAQELLEVVKDGVAVLTLNRPERLNVLSGSMLIAMLEALPRLADDPEVGVVVLTGAGRGFCAGGDVKAMAGGREFSGTFEEKAQALRSAMEVSRWLHEIPKVTIAMVRGAAAGAGLSLALACDMRVASDTARFATAFARVGYSGDFGGTWYLTQLIGSAKARELYYTADIVDAQTALALGIVNRVVPDGRLEEETMALATRLGRGPRIAYQYMKRNFNAAEGGTLKDSLDLEAWHHTRCGMTEDHREAARAFVDKREPVLQGRRWRSRASCGGRSSHSTQR